MTELLATLDWYAEHTGPYGAHASGKLCEQAATLIRQLQNQAATASIDSIIRDVAELPDRTSPDDQPEMMLVSADELRVILLRHLAPSSARPRTGETR